MFCLSLSKAFEFYSRRQKAGHLGAYLSKSKSRQNHAVKRTLEEESSLQRSAGASLKTAGVLLVLIHNYPINEHVVVIPDIMHVDLRVFFNPRRFDHMPISCDVRDRLGEFVVYRLGGFRF